MNGEILNDLILKYDTDEFHNALTNCNDRFLKRELYEITTASEELNDKLKKLSTDKEQGFQCLEFLFPKFQELNFISNCDLSKKTGRINRFIKTKYYNNWAFAIQNHYNKVLKIIEHWNWYTFSFERFNYKNNDIVNYYSDKLNINRNKLRSNNCFAYIINTFLVDRNIYGYCNFSKEIPSNHFRNFQHSLFFLQLVSNTTFRISNENLCFKEYKDFSDHYNDFEYETLLKNKHFITVDNIAEDSVPNVYSSWYEEVKNTDIDTRIITEMSVGDFENMLLEITQLVEETKRKLIYEIEDSLPNSNQEQDQGIPPIQPG